MNKAHFNEINILKALAIMLVVSGHLEFSIFGMFPPYSFQLSLFFFISGYLFKDKYLDNVAEFMDKRIKSLLVPYFWYNLFYLGVTIFIAKLTGKFWGMPITAVTPLTLVVIRTLMSVFFVYLGYFYVHHIKDNYNIFTPKWAGIMITLQSILWLFNRDFDPVHGIGLSFVLVWARFDQQLIVPILTSITGIWASLFTVKLLYPYLKDIKFLQDMGNVTYHIMANHLLVMYIITAILLKINGIPMSERLNHNIYWIYDPVQTTYLYFVLTMVITTYIGVLQKKAKQKLLDPILEKK